MEKIAKNTLLKKIFSLTRERWGRIPYTPPRRCAPHRGDTPHTPRAPRVCFSIFRYFFPTLKILDVLNSTRNYNFFFLKFFDIFFVNFSSFKIHFLGAIFGRSASVVRPEEEREPMRVFCRHSSILLENDRNNSRKEVHPSDFRGHMLKKSRNADFGDFWSKLKEGSHRLMLISVNLHHNSRAEKHQSIWFRNIDFSYGSLSSSGRAIIRFSLKIFRKMAKNFARENLITMFLKSGPSFLFLRTLGP